MRRFWGDVDGSALAAGAGGVDGGDRLYCAHAASRYCKMYACVLTLALLVSLWLPKNRVHDDELWAR
jgi:hypothetical protein